MCVCACVCVCSVALSGLACFFRAFLLDACVCHPSLREAAQCVLNRTTRVTLRTYRVEQRVVSNDLSCRVKQRVVSNTVSCRTTCRVVSNKVITMVITMVEEEGRGGRGW
jgi:hypothetical protein